MALSFGQQRLWFLDRLEPNSVEYLLPLALRLHGVLDAAALRQALDALANRHEVLRTRYVATDSDPMQVIDASAAVPLIQIDLRHLDDDDEREQRLQEVLLADSRQPFDLAQGPVIRATLVCLTEAEHVLLVTMHHIASDGWSLDILARELSVLYSAFVEDRPAGLPALPVQYADFAQWQRDWLSGPVLERQLDYWRDQLAGLEPLELPTDRPRTPQRVPAGDTVAFSIPAGLAQRLSELGRSRGATPFMVLLSGFQALLARYTGQNDLAVGTPIAGRTRLEVEPLIGFFINTLVLRTELSGDPSFGELVERVRETALTAYAHQDVPFERLVDELQPERDLSRNPLFQVMFVFQNTAPVHFDLSGLVAEPLTAPWEVAKFDLTLQLEEGSEGDLLAELEYATALFDRATIERMAGHYVRLLEHAAADPEAQLSRLELLSAAERDQLLREWNATTAPVSELCLHELFEEQARQTPEATAVVFGAEQLSYDELNTRANQLAHHLRRQGVGPETLVGVCMERSHEVVVALLGILKAGGAYVPLDPEYPRERLAFMLEDTGVPVVISEERFIDRVANTGTRLILLDRDRSLLDAEPATNPAVTIDPDALAYVIYTSGSTGKPKGVMVPH
ncbi:condensation domain-containing protein, partial [Rhizobium sp. NPDC090279]|uniref:condensation domain-containing protein n=1 Tax=Rhizobium sp. NPDC090279 TaxID=3364499 RepID=UPI00383AA9E0